MTKAAYVWLEQHRAEMLSDLMELANQNSGSDNLHGLLNVAAWLEDWMGLEGTQFTRIPLPPRQIIDTAGQTATLESAPALRWDFRPAQARRVLLAIHYDTVFGADSPFQSCERLADDRLQGPGVADAKGGIVVLRYALKALQKFALAEQIGWTVLLNPDEELGSPSSHALLQNVAPEFEFGLLFEPALPDGRLVAERKGSGNFTLVVHGKSAHAGRNFHDGRNAVAALCQLLAAIDALNGETVNLTINIGQVQGGGPVNIVPDLAIGRFNVRVADEIAAAWFEERLQALVASCDAREGLTCRCHGSFTSPPKRITPPLRRLMQAIEQSAIELGQTPVHWTDTGGVCDGNKLAAAGLPNIDTLGPLGGGLHSHDEWVQLSSILDKAKVIVNLLDRVSRSLETWQG